jgi:hypothetical protein
MPTMFEIAAGLALAGLVLTTLVDVARTAGELRRRERLPERTSGATTGGSATGAVSREGRRP